MWSDRANHGAIRALVEQLEAAVTGDEIEPRELAAWLEAGPLGPTEFSKPLATLNYADGRATIPSLRGEIVLEARAFDLLEACLLAWKEYTGAHLVGHLSYDLAAELEDVGSPQPLDFPQMHFTLWGAASRRVAPVANAGGSASIAATDESRRTFEESVTRIVAAIHRGDIFQTNLCRAIDAQLEGTAEDLFARLIGVSPATHASFLRLDAGRAVMSISPETFLKVDRRTVESHPIKGTRPRGATSDEDARIATELSASEKDRAELAMIVDVVRNDLARVCDAGSVKVAAHAELMSIPTVHHLVSRLTGRLRENATIVDLLRASFPAASISGAPKIEAIRIAAREEGQARGPAMGAIGWISMDGRMELSVAIRTAFTMGHDVRYYAGCGITADSVPADEYGESAHKAAAFLRALGSDPRG